MKSLQVGNNNMGQDLKCVTYILKDLLSFDLCKSLRGRLENPMSHTNRCVSRWTTTAELIVPLCPSVSSFSSVHYSLFRLSLLTSLLPASPTAPLCLCPPFTQSFVRSRCPDFISFPTSPTLLPSSCFPLDAFSCCLSFCFHVASFIFLPSKWCEWDNFPAAAVPHKLNPNSLKAKNQKLPAEAAAILGYYFQFRENRMDNNNLRVCILRNTFK